MNIFWFFKGVWFLHLYIIKRKMYGNVTSRTNKILKRRKIMLWTILIILLVLWALGFATSAVGNLVHILLVIAAVVLVLQLVRGRGV